MRVATRDLYDIVSARGLPGNGRRTTARNRDGGIRVAGAARRLHTERRAVLRAVRVATRDLYDIVSARGL
ncbi:MAG: hypothetical protein PVJ64_17440, partial [Gemmatimonadales bacterium]